MGLGERVSRCFRGSGGVMCLLGGKGRVICAELLAECGNGGTKGVEGTGEGIAVHCTTPFRGIIEVRLER